MRRKVKFPPQRPAPAAPRQRPVPGVPDGQTPTHAPTPHFARAPKELGVAKVPNPRLPKLVRDVRGGALKDLFELLPDLPRPRRPAIRTQTRKTNIGYRRKP
jgi:hypothetical protein